MIGDDIAFEVLPTAKVNNTKKLRRYEISGKGYERFKPKLS